MKAEPAQTSAVIAILINALKSDDARFVGAAGDDLPVSDESPEVSRCQASTGIDCWSRYPTMRSAEPKRENDPTSSEIAKHWRISIPVNPRDGRSIRSLAR
jgi:hypothetical protein